MLAQGSGLVNRRNIFFIFSVKDQLCQFNFERSRLEYETDSSRVVD